MPGLYIERRGFLDMLAAVRNTREMLGVPREAAFAMASANPADFLSLATHGRIAPGYKASLIALDADGILRRCWIDGTPV